MRSRTVDPDVIRVTHTVGTAMGFRLAPALAHAGLSEHALGLPGLRVTAEQTRDYLTAAQRTTGRDDLGLLVGARQTVTSWGMLGLAMLSADTLSGAVETGVRFRSLAGALVDVDLSDDSANMVLTATPFDDVADVGRFLLEEALSSIVALMRTAVGRETAPIRVEFSAECPDHAASLTEFFGCPVHYQRPTAAIHFPVELHDSPLQTSDPYCHRTTTAILDAEMFARRRLHGIVGQVESKVDEALPALPSLPSVAAQLHLSERTLRRRMAESGATFRSVVDRVRRERARELLRTGTPMAAIAHRCGLSDERSLRRALRRWFGTTASDLRADARRT